MSWIREPLHKKSIGNIEVTSTQPIHNRSVSLSESCGYYELLLKQANVSSPKQVVKATKGPHRMFLPNNLRLGRGRNRDTVTGGGGATFPHNFEAVGAPPPTLDCESRSSSFLFVFARELGSLPKNSGPNPGTF